MEPSELKLKGSDFVPLEVKSLTISFAESLDFKLK